MTVVVSGDSITFNDQSVQKTAATGFGFKNRIINGDMRIDQRNAGASVTANDNVFPVDRFRIVATQASKGTAQRNAAAVTPPSGFVNYLGFTSSSDYSVTTGDQFAITQAIEGVNAADLSWGTSAAQSVAISFWVRSGLTGLFGGSLRNTAATRSYPFSYTVNSANTWELKTINIQGDTAGTWATDTSIGVWVMWGLGVGSSTSGAAGAWASANYVSATGATSVVGTSGATFYITGVQLEKGSTATSFDYRDYGRELIMCQRYFTNISSNIPFFTYNSVSGITTECAGYAFLPVSMRAPPTATASAPIRLDSPGVNNYTQSTAQMSMTIASNNQAIKFLAANFTSLPYSSTLQLRGDSGAILLSAEL